MPPFQLPEIVLQIFLQRIKALVRVGGISCTETVLEFWLFHLYEFFDALAV